MESNKEDYFFVFGYGSLIFKPALLEEFNRHPAVVRGYKRRFWQGSTDHRGVPGSPGRVVTVLPHGTLADEDPHPEQHVLGVAFQVPESHRQRIMDYLDVREKGGYELRTVDLYKTIDDPHEKPFGQATLYYASPDNPEFLGPAASRDIAHHIHKSVGPSGKNREYLVELHKALRHDLNFVDHHVDDLVKHLPE